MSVPKGTEKPVVSPSSAMDVTLDGSLGYAEPQFPEL